MEAKARNATIRHGTGYQLQCACSTKCPFGGECQRSDTAYLGSVSTMVSVKFFKPLFSISKISDRTRSTRNLDGSLECAEFLGFSENIVKEKHRIFERMIMMCPDHYSYSSLTPMARYVYDLKKRNIPYSISWELLDENKLYKMISNELKTKTTCEVKLSGIFTSIDKTEINRHPQTRMTLSNYKPDK